MRAQIIIEGKVQGVGFRDFARRKATELKIKGFVRNVDLDKIEVVAEGDEKNLKTFVAQCKKGPLLAFVKKFEINSSTEEKEFVDFFIKY
ncbi:MAG TPA: acylphosphatase [Candidatus Nanoarchaeia archaeon]|nr:acylphosphatase [Candidatus Nanoarchaeia archaeon]